MAACRHEGRCDRHQTVDVRGIGEVQKLVVLALEGGFRIDDSHGQEQELEAVLFRLGTKPGDHRDIEETVDLVDQYPDAGFAQ
ncbi:hypothetical protein GGR36_002146 [Niveibacterium umoris]|uniref:Uncharacterized protein n=1 Tax=Niveibacterium umoris TaxID=1193620 RepID=A0A840BMQ9_9RHOO|nr:hypothetical protein [Niveibacterium umoris]